MLNICKIRKETRTLKAVFTYICIENLQDPLTWISYFNTDKYILNIYIYNIIYIFKNIYIYITDKLIFYRKLNLEI